MSNRLGEPAKDMSQQPINERPLHKGPMGVWSDGLPMLCVASSRDLRGHEDSFFGQDSYS